MISEWRLILWSSFPCFRSSSKRKYGFSWDIFCIDSSPPAIHQRSHPWHLFWGAHRAPCWQYPRSTVLDVGHQSPHQRGDPHRSCNWPVRHRSWTSSIIHSETCQKSSGHGGSYYGNRVGNRRWCVSYSLPQGPFCSFIPSYHACTFQGPRFHLLSGYCSLLDPHRSYHLCNNCRQVSLQTFCNPSIHNINSSGGKYAKKHVPVNLRYILSAESAANDGLAFPFLSLSIYLTLDSTPREAITDWIVYGCLCKVSSNLLYRLIDVIFQRSSDHGHSHRCSVRYMFHFN